MFANLIESSPPKPRSGGQVLLSLAFHVALGLGATRAGRPGPVPIAGPRIDPAAVFVPLERVVARSSPADPVLSVAGPAPAGPLAVGLPPIEGPLGIPPIESGVPIDGRRFQFGPVGPRCAECEAGPDAAGSLFAEAAVDEPARVLSQPLPVFPAMLRAAGLGGRVELSFVVDTIGVVESGSITVGESAGPGFVASARLTIERSRFAPARIGGQAVRQLVRQSFRFEVRP
jgi:TonB family protein